VVTQLHVIATPLCLDFEYVYSRRTSDGERLWVGGGWVGGGGVNTITVIIIDSRSQIQVTPTNGPKFRWRLIFPNC